MYVEKTNIKYSDNLEFNIKDIIVLIREEKLRIYSLTMQVGIKLIIALVTSTIFFSSYVFAKKLNILTEHLAPYQIVKPGFIGGLSTEIVKATLKDSKFEYSIEAFPWALSFSRATRDKNTCIYSLARIPQREPLFQWIGNIATSTVSLYSKKNSPINITDLNEAKKYKIAVIKDDVTHHFLLSKGFVENENLYVMNNYFALLKFLDIPSRDIDLVVINDDLINNRVNNTMGASRYKKVYQLKELTLNFHFACSLNTEQEVVESLINSMKKLDKQGTYSVIKKKWQKSMVNLIN
jgi:polar amino acid transport system substrate-binding protein